VTLKFTVFLACLQIEDFDGGIFTGHVHRLACFVEDSAVGGGQATVEGAFFLYHTHVPNFCDAIAVSGHNFVALKNINRVNLDYIADMMSFMTTTYTNVELAAVDGVVVAVESLNVLAGTDIPHRNCLITRAGYKDL